jgi:excisionase family DNA binding protein
MPRFGLAALVTAAVLVTAAPAEAVTPVARRRRRVVSQDSIVDTRLANWYAACAAWGFEFSPPIDSSVSASWSLGEFSFRATRMAMVGGSEVVVTLDVVEAWVKGPDSSGDHSVEAEGCHVGALRWHAQLSVPQVAERLGMTPAGVYKLIQRGRLEAIRESARKTRVRSDALERFVEEQQQSVQRFRQPAEAPGVFREAFEAELGCSPEQWIEQWKRVGVSDTPDNMRYLVRAVALREAAGVAPIQEPATNPWAVAAFMTPR